MSFLSAFESVVSCVGFMFGAPSISSPLAATTKEHPSMEELLFGDESLAGLQPAARMSAAEVPDVESPWRWGESKLNPVFDGSYDDPCSCDKPEWSHFPASQSKVSEFGAMTDNNCAADVFPQHDLAGFDD